MTSGKEATATQGNEPGPTPTLLHHLPGVLRLLRLSNSAPASVLVLLGASLCQPGSLPARAWLAAVAMWCVTAFGYVSNDIADLAEDRINKPDRPLPSGLVAKETAVLMAAGLAVTALAISLVVGWLAAVAAGSVLTLLMLYNLRLKAVPIAGNALVAVLAGCALSTGAVAAYGLNSAALQATLGPAMLLVWFIFGREALKTVEDVHGDNAAGKHTLALAWGAERTARWLLLPAACTCLIALWLWLVQGYSSMFLALVLAGVTLPLCYSALHLWSNAAPQRVSRCLALLKGSYFAGLLALFLR
jgi:geranylgeranylglycerol-phosphate geranylgeranyltransferase